MQFGCTFVIPVVPGWEGVLSCACVCVWEQEPEKGICLEQETRLWGSYPCPGCVRVGFLGAIWDWLALGAVQWHLIIFSFSEGFSEKCSMRGGQSACFLCCLLKPELLCSANTNDNLSYSGVIFIARCSLCSWKHLVCPK